MSTLVVCSWLDVECGSVACRWNVVLHGFLMVDEVLGEG